MCDFAPRNSCDFSLAILQLVAATAGLITPRHHVIASSDTVMLLADVPPKPIDSERELATELQGFVASINARDGERK